MGDAWFIRYVRTYRRPSRPGKDEPCVCVCVCVWSGLRGFIMEYYEYRIQKKTRKDFLLMETITTTTTHLYGRVRASANARSIYSAVTREPFGDAVDRRSRAPLRGDTCHASPSPSLDGPSVHKRMTAS
jgi:hypothetical protein